MEISEPYRTPEADLEAPVPKEGWGQITEGMVEYLEKTRPWVRFISVMGMVLTGLMFLVVLAVAVGGALSSGNGQPETLLMLPIFLVVGLIYFLPAYMLGRYAGAIKRFTDGGGEVSMEEALGRQYSFWRLVGIMALVVIAIYVVMIPLAVLIPTLT